MSIAALPVELLSKICVHLNFQEWVALRLSCRALHKSSQEYFAKTFYRKICYIATSESLHELEALSNSNDLREHVQELWMIPVVFDGAEGPLGMVSISSKSCRQVKGHELESRRAVQRDMIADNRNLLESEAFSLRLRECMDRFKNIQTIGLAYYRTEFLLDPRQQTVPFLGRRQMMSRIDFRFDVYSLRESMRTNKAGKIRKLKSLALSKLFLALRGSSCRPRKLSTCNSQSCCDVGPRIALSEEQFDSLLSTLEDLEDLHLCIDLNEATWLKMFRKLAPQLDVLTLSQDHMPFYLHEISFTRLRKLHINNLEISFSSLRSLLLSVKNSLVTLTVKRLIMDSEELEATENPSPSHQPTLASYEPTVPSYQPTLEPYGPTSPSFQPTSPSFQPTSPSFQPTPPSYQPTPPFSTPSPYTSIICRHEYGPAPLPALPASETAWTESAPQSPQHSSTSDSSEASTEGYWSRKWMSTYHPYEPSGFACCVCPTREIVMAWQRNEQKITCMPSFLDILRNELSLETLSLEDIISDGNYYYFERVDTANKQREKVEFDIRKANMSLKDWISRLRPIARCPPGSIIERKEDKG
ncbi:unnamed protein product [Penicillium olsonii]|nr:unnamed protein product [Penicillium olsonii]